MSSSKYNLLLDWFSDRGRVLVAFSGGLDSSLVAYAAGEVLGDNALAVTINSPLLPSDELKAAVRMASSIGIQHFVIDVDLLAVDRVVENSAMRCYYCKLFMLRRLREFASNIGCCLIVDGTNVDDLSSNRPGIRALREMGVKSPLAEVGLGKREIRRIIAELGLPAADRPSSSCLATRFPYGVKLTLERLKRVEKAESIIRRLTHVKLLRVRDHGTIVRIEVGRDERKIFFDESILDAISEALRALGYLYVTFELSGYVSGSMDRALMD